MTDGTLLSDEDVGLVPPGPASADASYDDHPLTVHLRSQGARPVPAPADLSSPASRPAPGVTFAPAATSQTADHHDDLLSDEDVGIMPPDHRPLANAADDGYGSGALKGIGTAAVKAVGNAVGFVGGIGNFADYLVARGEHAVTGRPVDEILAGMAKAKQGQQRQAWDTLGIPSWTDPRNVFPAPADVTAPILKRTGEYVPTSAPGRMAQAGVETALSAIGPGAGAKAGTFAEILRGGAAMAPSNMVAGAAGQGATELTGDPLLGMGAAIGAGGITSGAGAAAKKVVAPAVMGIPGVESVPIVGAKVAAARDNAAADQILRRSSDPGALRDWAAQPAASPDVPGSPQTLSGAVGNDRGLFQAEKDARNVDNLPFNAIDRAQSNAQQETIRGAQPEGDVFRPGQVIRQRLDALDQAAQAAEERLTAAHQEAVANRAAADQQGQDRLTVAFREAHDRASQAATDAAAPLQSLPTPEATGAILRAAQQEATDAARQARNRLYDAVDPDGTLATVVTPLKQAKDAIRQGIDPHAGVNPSGAEAALWSDIDRMPDVVPFRSLQKLDSRVTAAMADARRNPNPQDPEAIGRLTALKSATMDAIHNGVENQAAHEARLVEAGVMPAEDAMEARISEALQRKVDAFYADRESRLASGAEGAGADPRGGTARTTRVSGAGGAPRSGPRTDQGNQGVSQAGLQPNFDPAASERLNAAKAAHAAYQQTFKNPTVRGTLDTNGFAGQYKSPDSAIPSKWVVTGDKGYETARAFLSASGGDPRAVGAMQNATLNALRKNVPPVGNLHPNALARWKENFSGALRALDEVSPGFSSRFDDAAGATQALLDLGVEQKQALASFQREAAARSLAANAQSKAATAEGIAQARGVARDARATPAGQFASQGGERIAPAEVENAVGNMLKTGTQGAARMRSLVASVAHDPDAVAGLRKAGVDWIVRNFQNADGSMSGAKMINFIRDNKDVLKELYPTGQVSMFGAVARDIEVNSRWRTETAIKGGSDTGKNLRPMLEKAVDETKKHVSIASAATAGFLAGGPKGAMGGAGLYLLNSLRSAGIRSVDDLYREALADPEIARYLISKMPASVEGGKVRALTGALRRGLIVGPSLTSQSTVH